ncbi:hypothetical protein V6N12_005314 [Hibiscus sabdariffa]|uniref:Uncharacterized protein n=1 Tax=Hibiscus sabdariffa TaxID=183260 RepID=A0ABR2CQU2_9ROSI
MSWCYATMKTDELWDLTNSLVLRNHFMPNSGGYWKVYILSRLMVLKEFNVKPIVLKLSTLSILQKPPIAPLFLSDPYQTFSQDMVCGIYFSAL